VRLGRYLQTLSTPQPLDPLAVDGPVRSASLAVMRRYMGMTLGKFMETLDQLFILLRALKSVLLRSRLAPAPTDPPTDAQLAPDTVDGVRRVLASELCFQRLFEDVVVQPLRPAV